MRRHLTGLLLVLALGTACGAAASPPAPASQHKLRPTLTIVSQQPLVVRGTGFRSGERIQLLVTTTGVIERRVRAGSRGSFRIVLRLTIGRCDAVVVQALGARGSRAQVDLTQTACAPAP